MLQKAIDYFNDEYLETLKLIDRKPDWFVAQKHIQLTIQRCLGVAQFVQNCGVTFSEIDPHYEEIKNKLQKLLDNSIEQCYN